MIKLLIVCMAVLALLVINEWWFRMHRHHGEISRKFVHITVGSFVAFWPFFLSWSQIILLSIAFFVVVGISKAAHIFRAIHSVQRVTWGELFFAVAVGLVAWYLSRNDLAMSHAIKAVYAVAILHMSLADGLAAIIGVQFGSKTRYNVFGTTKSLVGTLTFFIASLGLLGTLLLLLGYQGKELVYGAGVALAASLIENLGVYGIDNLLVPLVVAFLLTV